MEDRAIEVSAPDTQEAIARGLALLNLSEQEVHVEIVDSGARGIFGIGARDRVFRYRGAYVRVGLQQKLFQDGIANCGSMSRSAGIRT